MLATADSWTLTTRAGDLDLCSCPPARSGYDDFAAVPVRNASPAIIVPVAALADVIRSKEAAGREKDSMQLPILRRTLEQIRAREL